MRTRHSTVARKAHGALHAVRDNANTDTNTGADTDAPSIEPFDDVLEHDEQRAANHASGAIGANRTGGVRGASETRGTDSTHRAGDASGMNRASETHHEPLSPDDPLAPLPFNPYKGNRGLTRAWHAMKNSLAGFRVAIREESAFRQELTLAAILLPCGVLVPVDPVSRVLLLGSVLLVLIVELLNSSVEAAIDRISLERHELSRRAKDLGSAAVMVALGMCVMTWGLIVGPLVVHWVKAWL
ncbi:diacylglycerol kinase [Paraburkholderia lacunae]|uniref:Diacylglycerol kinase n=1 Tax=Paraburkholderia lacunae TaxID=2211104 RepID=A0A370N723_9BURK|nr:diacylglycerol kinase [Paraburkholderia lacunae]RDK01417.1 diacylglycerol kinase [Paraburkholderia lacunae]